MKAVSAKLKESNPERASAFEKKAIEYVKKVLANFKDYEFVRPPPPPLISLKHLMSLSSTPVKV